MRLNRGTIILLVISVAVIIGAVVLGNNQASQPQAVTPTAASGGPLFTDLTAEDILSLEVRDTVNDRFTRIARESAADAWEVTGPEDAAEQEVNQDSATQAANNFIVLQAASSFEAENLADFGLAEPAYIITADSGAEALHVIYIGSRNPSGNRYYVITREVEAAEATEEPQAEGSAQVQLVNQTALQTLLDLVTRPPYMPTATPLPTATATLNPMSEVDIATATAEANATVTAIFATLEAEQTAEATAEVTAEATAETTAEAE